MKECPKSHGRDRGAVTIVETMIVLAIGLAMVVVWAQQSAHQSQVDAAKQSGRAIADFSRAASTLLVENPPTTATTLAVDNLQECNNPAGLRFLSCAYSADTTLPHIRDLNGDPVTFRDLTINVQVLPQGPSGTIDFGVFRGNADTNGDGRLDARPDLAAIALNEARTETSAGVLGFFEITFARENPAGIEFDPTSTAYDPNEIDNLARVQVRVGANAADTPFLRRDGSNQMTGALTFQNAMSITPTTNGLTIAGTGDVRVQAGELFADNGLTSTDLNVNTATVANSLNLSDANGAQGDGFDRLDQTNDVNRIDREVDQLDDEVDQINNDIVQINGEVNQLNSDITRIDRSIVQINSSVTSLDSRLAATNSSVSRTNTNVARNRSTLNSLTGRVNSNSSRITGIRSDVSTNSRRYSGLQSAVNSNTARFGQYCDTDCIDDIYEAIPDETDVWVPTLCTPTRSQAASRRSSNRTHHWNTNNCNVSSFSRASSPCRNKPSGCISSSSYCRWGNNGGGNLYISSAVVSGSYIRFNYKTRNPETLLCESANLYAYKNCRVRSAWTSCVNPK